MDLLDDTPVESARREAQRHDVVQIIVLGLGIVKLGLDQCIARGQHWVALKSADASVAQGEANYRAAAQYLIQLSQENRLTDSLSAAKAGELSVVLPAAAQFLFAETSMGNRFINACVLVSRMASCVDAACCQSGSATRDRS